MDNDLVKVETTTNTVTTVRRTQAVFRGRFQGALDGSGSSVDFEIVSANPDVVRNIRDLMYSAIPWRHGDFSGPVTERVIGIESPDLESEARNACENPGPGLLRAPSKIAAIKRVREITGWSLIAAKDFVNAMVWDGKLPGVEPGYTLSR